MLTLCLLFPELGVVVPSCQQLMTLFVETSILLPYLSILLTYSFIPSSLFVKVCRQWLVNRYVIESTRKLNYREYELRLNIPGVEPRKISVQAHQLILQIIETEPSGTHKNPL